MLTTAQLLKIDPSLADLSEAELQQLQHDLYTTAQLAFDVWWKRKSGSKNPVGSLAYKPVSDMVMLWKRMAQRQA